MSKKFKGRTCVYCAAPGISEDGDHVISRQFVLPEHRDRMPKVPACKGCNNAKSKLEHYLTAAMPFGARHAHARRTLTEMVPPRLDRNVRLRNVLAREVADVFVARDGGPWLVERALPMDSERLVQLFEMIAKGLAFHHWGIYLPGDTHHVKGGFLIDGGRDFFEQLMAQNAAARIEETIGDGAFVYEGAQGTDSPELTVWRMTLYGVQLSGDPTARGVRCSNAYVLTAPRRMNAAGRFLQLLYATVS